MESEQTSSKCVVVTGATGLIGSRLCAALLDEGYHVKGFSRGGEAFTDVPGYFPVTWQTKNTDGWGHELEGVYAVINLAGEPIASGRWTRQKKERILRSRLQSIASLSDAIKESNSPPTRFIQASAIGFYGIDTALNTLEDDSPGTGFLAHVCQQLENLTNGVPVTHTTQLRTGIVLDRHQGALPKMTGPMRFGICGYPGSGKQYVSWIHIDDQISAILHILKRAEPQRVYNMTAPSPVTIRDLMREAAKHKPTLPCAPVPPFMMALAFGHTMARETVLASQHVLPGNLLSEGFHFSHPDCPSAIEELFRV